MSRSYQVFLLAGGAGTRLFPMTSDLPKPLVPIAGKPVLSGLFDLLLQHKFTQAKLAVHYRSEQIYTTYGTRYGGLALSYYREEKPLGTAGCIAAAAKEDTRPLLVLSGDAVLEADLSALLEFHASRGAAVTMLLAHRADPGEYGVVLCEGNGKIKQFLEKPGAGQAFADTVNTGVYVIERQVLDLVPTDVPYDFARDLFPRLLAEGYPMYGYKSDGFWCDIGDFESYRDCNFRAAQTENIFGENCRVAESSSLHRCILHDGVTIGAHCILEDAILCRGVTIGNRVTVGAGAVIGADCILEDDVKLAPSICVASGMRLPRHTRLDRPMEAGTPAVRQISATEIRLSGEVCGEDFAACALAIGSMVREVGLMCSDDKNPEMAGLFIAQLRYAGVQVYTFEAGSMAMAAAMARCYQLPLIVHMRAEKTEVVFSFFDSDGLVPDRLFERGLQAGFRTPRHYPAAGAPIAIAGADMLYRGMLLRLCRPLSKRTLFIAHSPESAPLRAVLLERGATITDTAPLTFTLGADGMELSAREGERTFDFWHLVAILLSRMPTGLQVALPHTAPFSLTEIAERAGITMHRYATVPYDKSESQIRQLAAETPWLSDGSALAIALCSLLAVTGTTLSALAATLPPFVQLRTKYEASLPTAAFLSDFGLPAGDGVIRFPRSGCSVRLLPHAGGGFSLYTEAETASQAGDLARATETELFAALSHKAENDWRYSQRKDGVR